MHNNQDYAFVSYTQGNLYIRYSMLFTSAIYCHALTISLRDHVLADKSNLLTLFSEVCVPRIFVPNPENEQSFLYEEFEDTKGVIRIRISMDRQHNGQKKKYKRTNSDQQSIHIKLKTEKHELH